MEEIDRFPLAQLPSRYGIARSALYTRLKDLKIEPAKDGKRAYVNAQQIQLLDALHQHIQKGGITGEFLKKLPSNSPGQSRAVDQTDEDSPRQSRVLVQDSPGQILLSQPAALITVVETIVKRLIPGGGRLNHLRELEEAYEKGWLLSTSELADLLKLSKATVRGYGEQFSDAGFVFTRAGTRKRGEMAWKISKLGE
jgi:hypothetical protein